MKFAGFLAFAFMLPGYLHAYEMEDVKRIDFEVRDPNTKELFFAGTENITAEGSVTRKETW